MAYALVGTMGAVSTGATGASVTPVFGAGQSRTAGNLLVSWAVGEGSGIAAAGGITAGLGWTIPATGAGASVGAYAVIAYRIATGADAAPTWGGLANVVIQARVSEFSGNPTTFGTIPFGTNSLTTATSPLVATNNATDATTGVLICTCYAFNYSAAATKTFTPTLTGGTLTSVSDAATSTANHYHFGFSISTSNASADSISMVWTTTNRVEAAGVIMSFPLPAVAVAARQPRVVNRAALFSGRR